MGRAVCHYADLENAVDEPERLGRVATLAERHAGEALTVDAGDTLAPSLVGRETDGAHVPRVHDLLGTDLATVGNHDLDHGVDALLSVVADSPATYLSANIAAGGTPLAEYPGARRATRVEAGGRTLAVTGVTTTLVSDHAVGSVTAGDPVPAVRDALAAVDPDRDAALRVVVSHCGHEDERIARDCEVDLVLGGHVHDDHRERVGGALVLRPRPRGEHLLTVTLDQGLTATTRRVAEVQPDPAAVEAAGALRAAVGDDQAAPVTTLEETLPRSREALAPESRAGNLLADAVRAAADADAAVVDAGMLRPGPSLSGTVTAGDCRSLAPFDNDVHATTLSGAALRDLLANCAAPDHGADGGVGAHLSGVSVTYRSESGGDTYELASARVGSEPLDPAASYTVAAPTFPFHADAFAPLSVEAIETTHGDQHEALETHLQAVDDLPRIEGRIVVERQE